MSFTGSDIGSLIGGVTALVVAVFGTIKIIIPWWKNRRIHHLAKEATENAIRDVIVGRPGGSPNTITGESGRAPLLGISERLNEVFGNFQLLQESQQWQIKKLQEIDTNVNNTLLNRIGILEELYTELAGRVEYLHKLADKHHPGHS